MTNFKNILVVTVLFLIVINVYSISQWDIIDSRWMRVFTIIILGGCLARVSERKNLFLLSVFLLFLVCDFFILRYELEFAKYFYFGIHSLAYLLILYHIKSDIKKPKLNFLQSFYFLSIILINSFLLYKIASVFSDDINNLALEVLFYIHGFITIAIIMAAFSYLDNSVTPSSLVLFMSILALALSDVIMFSAYYIRLNEMYYLERALYVIGLSGLVRFSTFNK